MTKIDIFSGFLGAGKTTLIKKLLKEAYAGEKVVLIENEFGEIGIDGGFLREAGIEITEMNSGCICCTLVGDFAEALRKVLDEFHPDRILIEPSGVGKLSDVMGAVEGVLADDVVLNSAVTVADATKCRVYLKNFGEFYGDQVEHAGTIVLSRTAGMNEDKLAAAVALLRERNAAILAAMEKGNTLAAELAKLAEEAEHHHHDHDHDEHDDEHDHEHCCHHHDHDEHDHEHCCHHHDHDEHDHEHCCHHHDHDEHEHHHHHDHDEHECCHHHDHDEHEHHHHHHDHDEHCHCHDHDHEHHHHHHDGECDDPHCSCHHHHADEVFSNWGIETPRTFAIADVEAALKALDSGKYGTVLRAKGIVAGEGGQWIHFDYVPEEINVRLGGADIIGRLCVIGAGIDNDALATLFGVN